MKIGAAREWLEFIGLLLVALIPVACAVGWIYVLVHFIVKFW